MIKKWTKPWEEPEPEFAVKYVSSRLGRRPSLEPPSSPILGFDFKPCHSNDKYAGQSIEDLVEEMTGLQEELNYQKRKICEHLRRKIKGYYLYPIQIVEQMNKLAAEEKYTVSMLDTILDYSDGIDYSEIKTLHDAVDLLHLKSQMQQQSIRE